MAARLVEASLVEASLVEASLVEASLVEAKLVVAPQQLSVTSQQVSHPHSNSASVVNANLSFCQEIRSP